MLILPTSDLHSHLRSRYLPLPATQGNPILSLEEGYCWFLLRHLGHDLVCRFCYLKRGLELT